MNKFYLFKLLLLLPFITEQAQSQTLTPRVAEAYQLQQIIKKSEEQIELLREVLKSSQQDSASLERTYEILEKLSEGIDRSLESYVGSEAYSKALLSRQAKNDFESTHRDSKNLRKWIAEKDKSESHEISDEKFKEFIEFQKQSVLANKKDLQVHEKLQSSLMEAPAAFVPKIQTQIQLEQWKTHIRISTQLTEALSAMTAMREELRAARLSNKSDGLGVLIQGAEMQNKKVKELKLR